MLLVQMPNSPSPVLMSASQYQAMMAQYQQQIQVKNQPVSAMAQYDMPVAQVFAESDIGRIQGKMIEQDVK